MKADDIRLLFDYNYWARDRILAVMDGISEGEYSKQIGFTYGSIRGILTHCLDAEFGWRARFEGKARPILLTEANVGTVSLLTDRWRDEEAHMRDYLASLRDEALSGDLRWTDRNGNERQLSGLWLSLAHVINHSTQHRSEAAEALTMIGRSPGDLDLGLWAGQRRR